MLLLQRSNRRSPRPAPLLQSRLRSTSHTPSCRSRTPAVCPTEMEAAGCAHAPRPPPAPPHAFQSIPTEMEAWPTRQSGGRNPTSLIFKATRRGLQLAQALTSIQCILLSRCPSRSSKSTRDALGGLQCMSREVCKYEKSLRSTRSCSLLSHIYDWPIMRYVASRNVA